VTQMHVRTANSRDTSALAHAYIECLKSAYSGIIYPEDLNDIPVARVEAQLRRWFSGGAAVLAGIHKRDGLVGFIAAGESDGAQPDFPAEIYAHCVAEDYQGRGLGRRLLAAAAREMNDRRFGAMIVWLPVKNAATGFYEKLGGRRVATRPMVVEGKNLEGVGYGWRDLSTFSG
jgi:ribosomal protein S18 acetylase RimI-like enzyme